MIENKGKHITYTIHLMRHGEKGSHGELTDHGKKEARQFGKSLHPHRLKMYTSSHPRVVSTVEGIAEGLPRRKLLYTRRRKELSMESFLLDSGKSEFFSHVNERLRKAYAVDRLNTGSRSAVQRAEFINLHTWMSYDHIQPDDGTEAPFKVAQGVARLLYRQIEMLDHLKNRTNVDVIFATHEFVLGAILKYLLPEGSILLQTLGQFEYLEDIALRIKTDKEKKKQLILSIRGNEFPLSLERIQQLQEPEAVLIDVRDTHRSRNEM